MKKTILIVFMLMCIFAIRAQHIYYDETFESNLSKDELYSQGKMVIAESFNSANDVIQNEDIENGIILVKAATMLQRNDNMGVITIIHIFRYTLKIMFKDNKYRIIVNNVYNSSTTDNARSWHYTSVPVNNFNVKYNKTKKGYTINKKQYSKLMSQLNNEIEQIIISIKNGMVNELVIDSDW